MTVDRRHPLCPGFKQWQAAAGPAAQLQRVLPGCGSCGGHAIKQARDQDPQGQYIRQWVPEFGASAYPPPIVDERTAMAAAKEKLYGLRRTQEAHTEAKAIQQKHGSRKSGLPSTAPAKRKGRVVPDGQGELF